MATTNERNLYGLNPSDVLCYIGIVCFALTGMVQSVRLYQYKAWYFVPFVIGCVSEIGGYGARLSSASKPGDLGPYIAQALLLLLPPIFFAATIYMTLKKIVIGMEAARYSKLSVKWLTKVFVIADCVSLFLQAAGGGLQGSGDESMANIGKWVVIVGLAVQLVAFSYFLYLTWHFHKSMLRDTDSPAHQRVPATKNYPGWILCLYAIYLGGFLILIRSVYRVAEYAMGHDGYLMTHEVYFYIFDALLMFLTSKSSQF